MWGARGRLAAGVAGVGSAVLLLGGVVAPAQAADIELGARMGPAAGYPHCRGGAEYEAEHGQRELDLHLRGLHALAGKRVAVFVHGDRVGRARVSERGRVHLDRHGVPRMRAGQVLRVRTASGTLVSKGTLHRGDHDD